MLKISTKRVLLLGAVMALCASAPPIASAASWSPVGTADGVLDWTTLDIAIPSLNLGSTCNQARFNVTVDSAAVATVTGTTFDQCHGTPGTSAAGCTLTATGTGFPWRATALSTSDIRIHGFNVDIRLETTPPAGTVVCNLTSVPSITATGTLGIGAPGQTIYDPATKTATYTNTTGLASHAAGIGGGFGVAISGRFTATGLLNILD